MLERIQKIGRSILGRIGKRAFQVFIRYKEGPLVRFTNNGVHQNGYQELLSYTLRAVAKDGPAFIESNDFSESGVQNSIQRLETLILGLTSSPRISPSPSPLPQRGRGSRVRGSDFRKVDEIYPLSLERTPEFARQAIEEAIHLIREKQASANGYYSAYKRAFYLADSSGLERFHASTAVRFGITAVKGASKGYFSFYHPNPKRLQVERVVQEAIRIAEEGARNEVVLEPGSYECIFSPRAFFELIEPLRRHFDLRLYHDGKSVFSGQLGRPIFSKAFTLIEDVRHPGQFGFPFDSEGVPKKKAVLVERGVLKELLAEGHATRGWSEHPFNPQNLVVEEGKLSVREMFQKIRRGVFINKIWYHTLVREQTMEVTGLGTAGSLAIEKGRILGRAAPLRYHDSLFSILKSVVATTKEQVLLKDGEMGASFFPYLWVSRLRVVPSYAE